MLQRIRTLRKSDSGFTLTELLITIVILGVLAGIVVFAVGAFSNDGKTVACRADKKNVEVAVEAYRAKNAGANPASIDALVTANYLKDPPSTTNGYTIALDAAGVVTGAPLC